MVRARNLTRVADYQPGAGFGPRPLTDFEFVWLLAGSAVWSVWEVTPGSDAPRVRHLRPGMLALARAGTIDSYHWDPQVPSRHAYLHFTLDAAPTDTSSWSDVRSLVQHPVLAGICDYLVDLGGEPATIAGARTEEMIGVLLDLFVRGPLPAATPTASPALAALAGHVRESWTREGLRIVSVAELAEAAHVSTGQVFRMFRELAGCGPARALELVRLSQAAIALQRSNASLAEIAGRAGFANPYHFSRRFTRAYGMPPGRFRAEARDADPLGPVQAAGLLPLARLLTGG